MSASHTGSQALRDLMREHADYMDSYSEPFVGSTAAIARYLRMGADYIEQLERERQSDKDERDLGQLLDEFAYCVSAFNSAEETTVREEIMRRFAPLPECGRCAQLERELAVAKRGEEKWIKEANRLAFDSARSTKQERSYEDALEDAAMQADAESIVAEAWQQSTTTIPGSAAWSEFQGERIAGKRIANRIRALKPVSAIGEFVPCNSCESHDCIVLKRCLQGRNPADTTGAKDAGPRTT